MCMFLTCPFVKCVSWCVCVSVFLYIEVYTHIRMDSVYVDAKPFYIWVYLYKVFPST